MKTSKPIESLILTLRGQKVILDADLAALYGVPTKVFNQAVKRNADRFPVNFLFQLNTVEWGSLKSQIVTSSEDPARSGEGVPNRSQFATGSHGGRRTLPYAFTEYGALMAANVLSSAQAVKMSVHVVRAFISQRELLMARSDVLEKLAQMDAKLLKHDEALRVIWRELQPLLTPPPDAPKPRIGFKP